MVVAALPAIGFSRSVNPATATDGKWDRGAGLESFRKALKETAGNLAPGDFSEVRKRTASDLFTQDQFGKSVAVSGNTAVVGAPNDNTSPRTDDGSAYVLERNVGGAEGWAEVRKLAGLTVDGFEEFGYSVAISSNTIVVGKRYELVAGAPRNGTAYVFERNAGGTGNWGLVKTLTVSGATAFDGFGQSVAINGNIIAIGAPDENVNGDPNRGAVYLFYRNLGGSGNWGQAARVVASDGRPANRFGSAVSISGPTLVAGANRNGSGDFTYEGAAYVFERHLGGTNNWGEAAKLEASDASERSYFGWSVSIDVSTVIVGNYPVDAGFESNGAAYVFQRDAGGAGNWGEVRKLTAADGELNDYFGQSVAVRGDVIVVGAQGDSTGTSIGHGSAYVFERNFGGAGNWGERQKLLPADPGEHDQFGNAVAVDGKVVLAGSAFDDISGPIFHGNAGSAYFFVRETVSWVGSAKSVTAACTVDDEFGTSVAVDGDLAVVGTPRSDVGGIANQGAAYVFRRSGQTWLQVKVLANSDPTTGSFFGQSVTVSGDTIAVGAPFGDGVAGAVYIFSRNAGGADNWGETRKIVASDAQTNHRFGFAVSLDADRLAVGASGATAGGNPFQGAVYLFERNLGGPENWGETIKISSPDGASFDQFGISVELSGDRVVAGAPNHSSLVPVQGAAYVFERDEGGAGNWGMRKKFLATNATYNMQFGASVGIDGATIVVGAWSEKVGSAVQRGSAHIFERDAGGAGNWGFVRRIVAGNGTSYDYFGAAVAINADRIVVGSTAAGAGIGRGSSYLYERNSGGANNWGETRTLTATDGIDFDAFGSSVALDADDILVGARFDDVAGASDLGSVNAFFLDGTVWSDLGKFHPPTPQNCGADDDYGFSVAIDGDTAVVGAPKDDIGLNADQGSAYVLSRNSGGPNAWGLVRVLIASDGAAGDKFGSAVKISGDTIAVGAPSDDVGAAADQGSVYVFERNLGALGSWSERKRLTIAGGGANQRVGSSLALDADTLAVGYIGENTNTGSVHVFERDAGGPDNWSQTGVIRPSDPQIGQQFGVSVAISGDTMVVGSNLKLINLFQSGAAYVLERNLGGAGTWGESKIVAPSDSATLVGFGAAVDVDDDRIAVGAPQALGAADQRPGAVYLLERNIGGSDNWGEVRRLTGSDSADGDRFGGSVAIDGDSMIAGSPLADVGGNADQGAAYVFRQNLGGGDNWGEARKLFSSDGSAGDEFGISVGVSGENYLAGAYLARLFSSFAGAKSGVVRNGAGYFYGEASFAPTAANVSIAGRVVDERGSPVSKARIRLTGASGETMLAVSNPFGQFRFEDVETGRSYVISAEGKGLDFDPVMLFVDKSVEGFEMIGRLRTIDREFK
jgi:hypothetical protein